MRWLTLFLLCLGILGCSGKTTNKLVGPWIIQGPNGGFDVEFKEDGSYVGKLVQGPIITQIHGKYQIVGTVLEMDAPTSSPANGKPGKVVGNAMKMKMKWDSYETIQLDNAGTTFMMYRKPDGAK